ncbi:VOC family protein [Spirillospora sp. CA-255316]
MSSSTEVSYFVSHIALCVSDLERAVRFYTEGLGFELADGWDIGNSLAGLLETPPPVDVRAQMIVNGATKVELLGWRNPQAEGPPPTTRRNIGFTHLSVLVDDLRAAERRLVELGGTVIESSRTHQPAEGGGSVDILFVADPDGVRIELVHFTAAS